MNIDELNAKFDEIYAKNKDIQKLFVELEDHNEILFHLYDTEIKRPNAALNTLIDNYETLIFKIRESHKDIKESLDAFGDEQELAQGVNNNENLTDKVKDLILWKLRRLYMVYDEEPILPYVNGEFLNTDLIGNLPPVSTPPVAADEEIPEPVADEPEPVEEVEEDFEPVTEEVTGELEEEREEPLVSIDADVPIEDPVDNVDDSHSIEEDEDYDRFADPENIDPAGGIFPETVEDKN
ncbi:MAG: hypothetical protein MJE63_28200 [Proteobacteria bacterium]|nr:hypothetical protein [Pseudomonadota bacterium]